MGTSSRASGWHAGTTSTPAQSFTVTPTKLMGGAIQGNALSLADTVTTLAGTPGVNNPSGITTDGTNLYVTDTGDSTIKQIVIATGAVSTLATGFNIPFGITTDGTNLYMTDIGNSTVWKIVISTKAVTTVDATHFSSPAGITTDGTGLFVADGSNSAVFKIE